MSGPELDWVIVRENSEGEYAGVGGRVHRGLPLEVATDVSIMTRAGVERIFRFAFALAVVFVVCTAVSARVFRWE